MDRTGLPQMHSAIWLCPNRSLGGQCVSKTKPFIVERKPSPRSNAEKPSICGRLLQKLPTVSRTSGRGIPRPPLGSDTRRAVTAATRAQARARRCTTCSQSLAIFSHPLWQFFRGPRLDQAKLNILAPAATLLLLSLYGLLTSISSAPNSFNIRILYQTQSAPAVERHFPMKTRLV